MGSGVGRETQARFPDLDAVGRQSQTERITTVVVPDLHSIDPMPGGNFGGFKEVVDGRYGTPSSAAARKVSR